MKFRWGDKMIETKLKPISKETMKLRKQMADEGGFFHCSQEVYDKLFNKVA